MCSYLLDEPSDTTPVVCLPYGTTDIDIRQSLITGGQAGRETAKADQLCIVDMHDWGVAERGYVSTWGQTGCTVILVLQETGHRGRWAYFSHVTSNMIEQALEHACYKVSELPNQDSIIFAMMGGPGGKNTYVSLLRRVRRRGAKWRFLVLLKPENLMEECVVCIEECTLAFTGGLVSRARSAGKQLAGFVPQRVPKESPKPVKVITGHAALDEQMRESDSRLGIWIDLTSLCSPRPKQLPDDDFKGLAWMMKSANLQLMLECIAARGDYPGLVPAIASGLLLKHLWTLPEVSD